MNKALWTVQIVVALLFMMSGAMKLMTPPEELIAQGMNWVSAVPPWLPKLAGASELLGALGLILPSVTRIMPKLTPLAAIGLVVVMLSAAGLHASLGEYPFIGVNLVLGGLAGFVAWGRTSKHPIAPKA